MADLVDERRLAGVEKRVDRKDGDAQQAACASVDRSVVVPLASLRTAKW